MLQSSCMRVSTQDIHPDQRNRIWMESVREHLIQVDCPRHGNEGIDAVLEQTDCGIIRVNRVKADTHSVNRSRTDIETDGRESVFMCAMLEGHGYSWQGTQCANHAPGDIVLYDTSLPYGQGFPADMEMFVVDIPREIIDNYLGGWAFQDLVRLDRRAKVSSASTEKVHQLLVELTNYTADAQGISEQLLGQINSLLGSRGLPSSSRSKQDLLYRATRYIETHLSDDTLSTDVLCEALNTSPRQLARAFELKGTPPNRYIWNARLERCKQEIIANPSASISDIAFRFGFNHSAHFSRSYKNHFGESPSQTRGSSRG